MAMDGYSSEGGRITDSEEQFLLELSPIPINQYTNMDYLTDFWGPVSNFGIPVAAVMDTQKSPELYVTFFSFAPRTKPIFSQTTLILSLERNPYLRR